MELDSKLSSVQEELQKAIPVACISYEKLYQIRGVIAYTSVLLDNLLMESFGKTSSET
jgi:hypothetical protein